LSIERRKLKLQTDQRLPEITSADSMSTSARYRPKAQENHIGPKAPKGKEANWLQTVPNKGWFCLLRLYSPTEAWFDKTWKPGDPELVE
jgi:hypothetical protein